jgi:hypothetical protein
MPLSLPADARHYFLSLSSYYLPSLRHIFATPPLLRS